MVGVELHGGAPRALSVTRRLLRAGWIVLTGGVRGDVLTLTPSLDIDERLLDAFADALSVALRGDAQDGSQKSFMGQESLRARLRRPLHRRVARKGAGLRTGPPGARVVRRSLTASRSRALSRLPHVPGYARLCGARGLDPRAFQKASEAPAVPTDAFKMGNVFCFDESAATVVFRTGGTTVGARGAHAMRDVASYDAAAVAFGRAMLGRDLRGPAPILDPGARAGRGPRLLRSRTCAGSSRTRSVTARLRITRFSSVTAR